MKEKIFRCIFSAALAVFLASLVIITGCMYGYFGSLNEKQLKNELALASAGTEQSGTEYLRSLDKKKFRLTLIKSDGTVAFDTAAKAEAMENHMGREEIKEAFEEGRGSSSRYSATLTEKTLYEAVKLSDGSVLRISRSHATVGILVWGMMQPILVVLFLAVILSTILAGRMAKSVVAPLNSLNLEKPFENEGYEELAPLLNRIAVQHRQIEDQLEILREKKDEFDQVAEAMREGLILLDRRNKIVSINSSGEKMFGTDKNCTGEEFLTLERKTEVTEALRYAMENGRGESFTEREGRKLRLLINRIESAGKILGSVILALDITEQAAAEEHRREFTANVSHELKTPLQSILGSVDLIENNMVKESDLPRFVGYIGKEAKRLLALIEDIIRLSRLDEGEKIPEEKVEILALAKETAEALEGRAKEKNVTLTVSGCEAEITGVKALIYEIIYNLCDNAIRYNKEGGRADVTVTASEKEITLTVKDTGIGIAGEDKERIFERFYRVDKSHSRESGGTGLGLSIVKHAVQLHNGKIEIDSIPGAGTSIRISFKA